MAKTSAELALLQETDKSPSGFRIVWREIVRDKLALVSLIFLFTIIAAVYGISLFLDQKRLLRLTCSHCMRSLRLYIGWGPIMEGGMYSVN